ncbi:MAG TPA: C45 family autoproteolytic acyltransferase/hydrolase [Devosia sp.]|nr:C45 family autoproteolytic acyltransferase/hydrolase [Devosia sp.]
MPPINDFTPPKAFPFIRSEGSSYEVGIAHGRAFGDLIRTAISVYRGKFDKVNVKWSDALVAAERGRDQVRAFDTRLADEYDGIAKGAELDPREIMAINLRVSLLRLLTPKIPEAEKTECTTTAVIGSATANGHTLMGQNWDQAGALQAFTVIIEQHVPGEPALLFLTEAGSLFRHGMNDAGVGICGNALISDQPTVLENSAVSALGRRLALRETNLADAHRVLFNTPPATPGNHLMASAEGKAIDIESSPTVSFNVEPEDGIVVHSNHFLNPKARDVLNDLVPKMHPSTLHRYARVRDHLQERRGAITTDDIRDALHDHFGYPTSVCNHPHPNSDGEVSYTLASSVLDLNARKMWTAPGPGCIGHYTEYSFS